MHWLNFSNNLGLVISVLTVIFVPYAATNKYNVSLAQMDTCKELTLRNTGYAYIHFFHIHHMDNNKVGTNERLHLKFYVLAAMDAHILLATNDKPRSRDHVYEVGACGGFS